MTDSFVVAPSVQWTERDATLTTKSGLAQNAAIVGEFAWGPIESPIKITSGEAGLVSQFWKPTKDFWLDFLVAADFFRYSNSAWVVRAAKNGAMNAAPTSQEATLLKNISEVESYAGLTPIVARYGGALGNNINTYVMDTALMAQAKAEYNLGFRTGVASLWLYLDDKVTLTASEYNVIVFDRTGAISGETTAATPDRKHLSIEWGAAETDRGFYLGTQLTANRIKLQVAAASADEAVLAAALVAQFNAIPESIKRLNNIRAIVVKGDSDFEVEFYEELSSPSQVWYETASEAFGAATAVIDLDQETYGSFLESFEKVSTVIGSKKYTGSNAYYKDDINENSLYVAFTDAFGDTPITGLITLTGGSDGTGEADYQSCYSLLDARGYDFLALIGQGQTIDKTQGAIDVALSRRTSVAFIAPPAAFVTASRINKLSVIRKWRDEDLLRDNSYFFMTDNWGEVYDQYNGVWRYIPTCGGTAGLWFRSVAAAGIAKSPAFYNRGKYLGYRKMAWTVNDDERSELFNSLGVNSIVSEREGIILMGDKTGLSRSSAFSRIGTRGIFIEIEVNISSSAKYILGEDNDVFTQSLFRNTNEPYLRGKKESGQITDYRIKCDETNNTGQVVAENKFVAGIWIKPKYSINFIYLDFAALRPDMEFSELEGNYGTVSV